MGARGAGPGTRMQADGEDVDDDLLVSRRLRNLEPLVVRRLVE
jgi:hypothetical protein